MFENNYGVIQNLPVAYQDLILLILIFIGTLFFIENFLLKAKSKQLYSSKDTLANLLCGFGGIIVLTFLYGPLVYLYQYLFLNFHVLEFVQDWKSAVLVFIFIDFTKYAYHYASHKNNFLWAIHLVHHQSTRLNFSTTFRWPWYLRFVEWPIHLPAALIGFDVQFYFSIVTIHAFIQIRTHTEAYDFPYLGRILILPSHHRVHYAIQDNYQNANFGAVFSIWDHIFGTFKPEDQKPTNGLKGAIESYNVLELNNQPLKTFFSNVFGQKK